MALLGVQFLYPFNAYATPLTARIAGQDRYETVKKTTEYCFGTKVDNIVLATGTGFADAVSSEVMAQRLNAPLLLVGGQGITQEEALDFIHNNLAINGKIHLIGGSGVFKADFSTLLRSKGVNNVEQFGGLDKYHTNSMLLEKSEVPQGSPIFMTSGDDFPDSMAISNIAANKGWPILFTNKAGIIDNSLDYVRELKPSTIYIVGGYAVVPQSIESEMAILAPQSKIVRISGEDRYATLAQVFKTFNLSPTNLVLAADSNLSDAFSASTIAAKTGDPFVMVDAKSETPPKGVADYLFEHKKTDIGIISVGGSAVVSNQLVSSISNLLDGSAELNSIYSIANLNVVLTAGDTFNFPQTMKSLLYDSTTVETPVTWGSTTLDTSTTGVYSFSGSVAGFPQSVKLTVTINKKKESYENLRTALITKLGSSVNNVGISFQDLTTGTTFSINGDQKFLAASTAKVPRVLILYDLIREGKVNENQLSYYKQSEYEGGTGIMQYGNLKQPFSFTTLAQNAMQHSDNIAMRMIGDNMCEQAEEGARVRKLIGHDMYNGDNNILSANDARLIMNTLYTGASKGDVGYQKIVGWLKTTDFHDRLDKDMTHSVVAHKIGNLNEATNDIGIFYTNRPYILTVYTSYLSSPNSMITSISDIVYDYQAIYGS